MTPSRSSFRQLLTLCSVTAAFAGATVQAGGTAFSGQPRTPSPMGEDAAVLVQDDRGLAGHWQGSLKASPVIELRLVLEIERAANGALSGVMISVDQGGVRIPLTTLTEKNGAVHLELSGIGASFDGASSQNGTELTGQWRQGGNALPLVFKRLAAPPTFGRPQEPTRPYPYEEEEVTFASSAANVALAGTFTRPRGPGPHPAVVLISGSGPQDRDEAVMGHRPFLVLADHLTRQGIAVLRYDDRGTGKSTGNFGTATHDDFVSDALAAVSWLRTRPEVDPARIGLVGHSEGGLAAPLAAVKRPGDIAFVVLLAGPGLPMQEVLVQQAQDMARVMGASAELVAQSAASQEAAFALLRQDLDPVTLETRLRALIRQQAAALTDEQRAAFGYSEAMMESQVRMVLTPWFRQLLVHDPGSILRQVKAPVLAIGGDKDLQVAARPNLTAIRDALTAGGNTDVTTRELVGLNHLFQTAVTGAVTEYSAIQETFSPAALAVVSDWIRRRTGLD